MTLFFPYICYKSLAQIQALWQEWKNYYLVSTTIQERPKSMNALVKGHSFQPQNHYKKYRDSNKAGNSETCLHQLEHPHQHWNLAEWMKKIYHSLDIVWERWKIIPKSYFISFFLKVCNILNSDLSVQVIGGALPKLSYL